MAYAEKILLTLNMLVGIFFAAPVATVGYKDIQEQNDTTNQQKWNS